MKQVGKDCRFRTDLSSLERRAPPWSGREEAEVVTIDWSLSMADLMTTQDFEPLLTVAEAALLLGGIHPKTLMRLARLGEVPAIKIGRCWFFRASALNDWIGLQSQSHRPCLTERIQ